MTRNSIHYFFNLSYEIKKILLFNLKEVFFYFYFIGIWYLKLSISHAHKSKINESFLCVIS